MNASVLKCKEIILRDGIIPFIRQALAYLSRTITVSPFAHTRYCLFKKDLNTDNIDAVSPKTDKVKLMIISSPCEFDKLVSEGYDFSFCKDLKYLKDKICADLILFCAFVDNKPSHISFVALTNYACVDPFFKNTACENAGYIGPCYTNMQYRGLGLYPYVLLEICAFLKGKGIPVVLISTAKTNIASVKGITKAGFNPFSEGYCLRIAFYNIWKKI